MLKLAAPRDQLINKPGWRKPPEPIPVMLVLGLGLKAKCYGLGLAIDWPWPWDCGLGLKGLALAQNSRPKCWRTTMFPMNFHRLERIIYSISRSTYVPYSLTVPTLVILLISMYHGLECSGLEGLTENDGRENDGQK